MQVTKLTRDQLNVLPKQHRCTEEDLQQEYKYVCSEQMTRKLLDKGFITENEYKKIMAKNRQSFSPLLAELYPSQSLIRQGIRGNMSPNEEEVS